MWLWVFVAVVVGLMAICTVWAAYIGKKAMGLSWSDMLPKPSKAVTKDILYDLRSRAFWRDFWLMLTWREDQITGSDRKDKGG